MLPQAPVMHTIMEFYLIVYMFSFISIKLCKVKSDNNVFNLLLKLCIYKDFIF